MEEIYNDERIEEPTVTIARGGVKIGEKYLPDSRKWQGIATIETTGDRIWAAWMAGGVKEPDPENHIVVGLSDDGANTWIDPFLVIDNENPLSRGRDPVLWRDSEGALWLFYGFWEANVTYALKIENPEAPLEEIRINKPFKAFGHGMLLNKPIETSEGEWLCMFDPFDKERKYSYNCCYASDDQGMHWYKKGEICSRSPDKLFQEGTLVEKRDGSLWCVTRIEGGSCGGLEQSFSRNGGTAWSVVENDLPEPFRGPGSKACLRRLHSGNLLFVHNASPAKERINMTAYLSEDDGKTWRSLLLDGRPGCAYPDIAEDEQGNIYVIFDSGRSKRNEIRFCRFREADVRAGEFFSVDNVQMGTIAKNKKYRDIRSMSELSDGEISVTDERGETFTLSGRWTEKMIGGSAFLCFVCDEDRDRYALTDPLGILRKRK